LASSLEAFGLGGQNLIRDGGRPTTRKTRVLANHSHQVLRIDHEEEGAVSGQVEDELLERTLKAMEDADVVLISDYQKGTVTGRIVRGIVQQGARTGKPVVANPKPRSLPYYEGAALVSLNAFEAGEAAGLGGPVGPDQAEATAMALRERLGVGHVLVTLGGSGMAAAGETAFRVPAVRVEVYDEAGAGDTVIATVALGMASGAFGPALLSLAAQTAAAVVRKVGVAVPSPEDLAMISRAG
jgi:D-beta-D-heptose 7-phosphate kinase/D-beta-D-heptose 1-phosphate adenosyltransferase